MALERECQYAMSFPFVDYGLDIEVMAELERGIILTAIKRSDADSNPPEPLKRKIEEGLSKLKAKR